MAWEKRENKSNKEIKPGIHTHRISNISANSPLYLEGL
jgi:hypothetical protein